MAHILPYFIIYFSYLCEALRAMCTNTAITCAYSFFHHLSCKVCHCLGLLTTTMMTISIWGLNYMTPHVYF